VLLTDAKLVRELSNTVAAAYGTFFTMQAVILLASGCVISLGILRSRLETRKRELSVLRALGAKTADIVKAVRPETVADYIGGAAVSILVGVFMAYGMAADGGARLDILSVVILAVVFLCFTVALQLYLSQKFTKKLLSEADNRL